MGECQTTRFSNNFRAFLISIFFNRFWDFSKNNESIIICRLLIPPMILSYISDRKCFQQFSQTKWKLIFLWNQLDPNFAMPQVFISKENRLEIVSFSITFEMKSKWDNKLLLSAFFLFFRIFWKQNSEKVGEGKSVLKAMVQWKDVAILNNG